MFTLSLNPEISLHSNHVTNPSGLISRAQCLEVYWYSGWHHSKLQSFALCDSGAQTLALNLQRLGYDFYYYRVPYYVFYVL